MVWTTVPSCRVSCFIDTWGQQSFLKSGVSVVCTDIRKDNWSSLIKLVEQSHIRECLYFHVIQSLPYVYLASPRSVANALTVPWCYTLHLDLWFRWQMWKSTCCQRTFKRQAVKSKEHRLFQLRLAVASA